MSETLELAKALISRPSVTPDDAACQAIVAARLRKAGFAIEAMMFGEVENLWARRGQARPLLAFAGHTDVVPPGPRDAWTSDPFVPEVRDGMLYGRGAADMKSGIAAMVVAVERFVARHPDHRGSIAFLLTSDEEGPSVDGTVKVIERLERRGEKIDWCLIGEPSSESRLGDAVKNGRRGSLNGVLKVRGIQGHVAYPHLARNPIHDVAPALAELTRIEWDRGNDHFPPTGFQISNINGGTGAENIIPGAVEVLFNFRFSTEQTAERLRARVEDLLRRHELDYELNWRLSGDPFLTPTGELVDAARNAIREVTGVETQLSTGGGTSDGRFIAPTGAQVLEVGPINRTIHKVDECVPVADLEALAGIYERVLAGLLA
ncbi:MAG: Succinyl-diaminopimelate desuccinylase [Gammaproteobacteria bacterium]|nr:Succinyl-diaminopimelate desuccinylase [Gammaproteobacteria bacterium]